MDGVGWITDCHHDDGMRCPDASHWIGPWGNCPKCSTEKVALAVEERIARELEILSDSYIEQWKAADAMEFGDIWTWTAELAKRVRAGEFTQPLDMEPPF